MRVTELEMIVLVRCAAGNDPWNGRRGSQSRTVSQALQRLVRKGLAHKFDNGSGELMWMTTATGHDLVADHFRDTMKNDPRDPGSWRTP